ncbi:outer membrane beta-barrel protein [Hymenobacter sp. RP-2-7]|uniref:Outer membrane beta-barrel protein n=1 Tax=Hymenobacter polaris TaxID=2682546 RepID=A0A7Y0AB35_9BACT|nr:outer membrane beta-barrel protein [Hymenobacter polaris]NML63830.1 outer membrane beta-barrel protein [Hymenobacter polaris]
MMTPRPTILAALLLGAPLLSRAQTPVAPTPLPRLYGGLAAYVSSFQSIGSGPETGFPLPLQATVGYQLRPRLAVQGSVAYRGGAYAYTYTNRDYFANGQVGPAYEISGVSRRRALSAAVLTRLTLTRQAAHRLQFDLLAGLTLERIGYVYNSVRTDSAAAPVAAGYSTASTGLLVTAGPGLRYRFGPHLEATYNWLFSTGLAGFDNHNSYYYRSSASMALGVQYRFGRH